MRLAWTLEVYRRGDVPGFAAKARWFFWRHIRRWETELCHRCGNRVGARIGSWWHAPDSLWLRLGGGRWGVLCPSCAVARARGMGLHTYWMLTEDVSPPAVREER